MVAVLDALFPLYLLIQPSVGVSVATLFLVGPQAWYVTAVGTLLSGLYLGHGSAQIGIDATLNSLQALLAWSLVKRYIGIPFPLFKTTHMVGFHLLVGPIAMSVGATLKVLAYWTASIPSPYSHGMTLVYLCLAQSFGSVVITPVAISLFHHQYPWDRRRTSVAIPVLTLLLWTFYARWLIDLRVRALHDLTLSRQADQLAKELGHQMSLSASILRAASSFFGASEGVSSTELDHFLNSLVQGRVAPEFLSFRPRHSRDPKLVYKNRGADLSAFLSGTESVEQTLTNLPRFEQRSSRNLSIGRLDLE